MRSSSHRWLGELLGLHAELMEAAGAWSTGAVLPDSVRDVRHAAVLACHRHYRERIPAYVELADAEGLGDDADLPAIVNGLMVPDELFKSYQPDWLEGGDFASLTGWLASLYAHEIDIDTSAVQDVHAWRALLRRTGVHLSYSSGTSGRMSFVPRDPLTWKALRSNSASYADTGWTGAGGYDCLVAGPRGDGMGIQAAAVGLARGAAHARFLYDTELTADAVLGLDTASHGAQFRRRMLAEAATAFIDAREFLLAAQAAGRRVLVFGAPYHVERLCRELGTLGGGIALPAGSAVVTGGGWKSFAGARIPRAELARLAADSLGLSPNAMIDAYSTAELNCALVSCREGSYHIPPLIEPVLLDEALRGEIGATGYGTLGFLDPFATSYPGFIITGDRAQLVDERCACGLTGFAIVGDIERAPREEVKGCGGVMASVAG